MFRPEPEEPEQRPRITGQNYFATGRYHTGPGGYWDARLWKAPDQRQRELTGYKLVSREPVTTDPPRESGLVLLKDGTWQYKAPTEQRSVTIEEAAEILKVNVMDLQDWWQKVIVRRLNASGKPSDLGGGQPRHQDRRHRRDDRFRGGRGGGGGDRPRHGGRR